MALAKAETVGLLIKCFDRICNNPVLTPFFLPPSAVMPELEGFAGTGVPNYYQRRMAFVALVQLQTVPYKNNYYTEVTQMSAAPLYPVRPEVAATTLTDEATYKAMYQKSVINPDGFWREQAQRIDWIKPFTKVKQTSFDDHHVDIKWFADGTLNVSSNCLDRHLEERGDQLAIIWEGDDPSEHRNITYRELHEQVCKFANALRGQDVHRGDVVTIYMPMIPEAVVAMLACARIGAIHSVVFGGFSPEALAGRIIDCESKVVITADEGVRGGRRTPLKANVDLALTNPETKSVQKIIVCKRTGGDIAWHQHRDIWYEDLMKVASSTARQRKWVLKKRCSSFIPLAPRASRRVCCTPPAVTWCMPR